MKKNYNLKFFKCQKLKIHSCFIFFLLLHCFAFSSDIAIISLAVGPYYKKSVKLGIENKKLYAKMHGYDFICGEEYLDPSRPIAWSKVLLIQDILQHSDYKWIFWSDADSLIMNLGIPLEQFLDSDYNLIIGKDFNGINSGQFFLKKCPWSLQLLLDIYAHTECIYHPWWEQRALQLELRDRPELLEATKVVPQRLFNSFSPEIAGSFPAALYQTGDFILHFPGTKNLDRLSELFHNYSKEVINCPEYANLDLFLKKAGFYLSPLDSKFNEGYMTKAQQKQFIACLQKHPHIKKIAEIGLNAGHSAENFFQNCPELEQFISFDIGVHEYTKVAREYLEKKYKERFICIPGDSADTVPEFCSGLQKCDLIYIDGSHNSENVVKDIVNCRKLANENSILWIDDYDGPGTRKAVLECQKRGIIKIVDIHSSRDPCGSRVWVEARFI